MSLLDLSAEDRVLMFEKLRSPDLIYELISKHLGIELGKVISKYKINIDFIKNRIYIDGDPTAVYELFCHLEKFNVKFESVTPQLRINTQEFLTKIK